MDYSTSNIARSKERSLLRGLELNLDLKQMITMPTRIKCKTQSVIDLIFVNDDAHVSKSEVLPNNISAHDLIMVCFKKAVSSKTSVSFTFRGKRNYN